MSILRLACSLDLLPTTTQEESSSFQRRRPAPTAVNCRTAASGVLHQRRCS